MQKAEKPPLARVITDFVSNAPVICKEATEQKTSDETKTPVSGYRTKVHQLRYFNF